MAVKQAQILSFDDVKRSTRASEFAGRSVRQPARPIYVDSSDAYSPRRRNAVIATAASATRATVRSTRSIRSASADALTPAVDAVQKSAAPKAKRASRASKSSSTARASRGSNAAGAPATFGVLAVSNNQRSTRASQRAEEAKTPQLTKTEERKRARAKKRADKKFNKEFGALDEARNKAAAAQSGPRAAVYKTEMGASQKKASRMQQNAAAKQGSGKASVLGALSLQASALFEAVSGSRKAIAGIAVAAVLVLTCVFLYPTAQTYYQTVRENDRLQAEYAALTERNEQLESNVSSLQTETGIEMRARDQLGWVKKGETSVSVSGLENVEDSSTATEKSLVQSVDSEDVAMPTTWYSPMLDLIFGVS